MQWKGKDRYGYIVGPTRSFLVGPVLRGLGARGHVVIGGAHGFLEVLARYAPADQSAIDNTTASSRSDASGRVGNPAINVGFMPPAPLALIQNPATSISTGSPRSAKALVSIFRQAG